MYSVKIETAQNVDIEYEIANVGDRIVAALIDFVILIAYYLAVFMIMIPLGEWFDFRTGMAFFILVLYLPYMLYDLVCEIFMDGQSFGKKLKKLKVIRIDGTQAGIGSYLLRWILRPVDITLFMGSVAMLTILISGRGQRLGDIAAGTTVVKLRPTSPVDASMLGAIGPDYTPLFPQAVNLDDNTIETIKEILRSARERRRPGIADSLLARTKAAVEKRLHITSELDPAGFLSAVVRDYGCLYEKIDDGAFQKKG